MDSTISILWFRQDLRLDDNPALAAAARSGPVIPLYIFSPNEEGNWPAGNASRWWLASSLRSLDGSWQQLGSRLIIRAGCSGEILREIGATTGARRVICNRRYEPAAVQLDQQLAESLRSVGIQLQVYDSSLLFNPSTLVNQQGAPYRVFTPFWNRCLRLTPPDIPIRRPDKLSAPKSWPDFLPAEVLLKNVNKRTEGKLAPAWNPGEPGGMKILKQFLLGHLKEYVDLRDLPDADGTSRLSPYLHFGELSARQVWYLVRGRIHDQDTGRDATLLKAGEAFLRQIAWREFAYNILHHFPSTPEQPSHSEFARFPWRRDEQSLSAWQQGQTGYPMVDAGMRQLHETGWMHNRVRMIVASFLTKHLLIHWSEGAKWFWETLVDADLANNTFGWQWAAGCGHDAAPYFRIFNPVMQGQKFDPDGHYVRRWIPELSKLPAKYIHQPWAAPAGVLDLSGIKLGQSYPFPIVEHSRARARALSALATVRDR